MFCINPTNDFNLLLNILKKKWHEIVSEDKENFFKSVVIQNLFVFFSCEKKGENLNVDVTEK